MLKTGQVYYCEGCTNFHVHTFGKPQAVGKDTRFVLNKLTLPSGVCDQCGGNYKVNGPVWLAGINDLSFVDKCFRDISREDFDLPLASSKQIKGMLHSILEERELADIPYSIATNSICKFLKSTLPSQKQIVAGITSLGFRCVPSYLFVNLWKTNAPQNAIFDMIRAWKLKSKGNEGYFVNIQADSHEHTCLSKSITHQPNFEYVLKPEEKLNKMPHFFPHPEKNWGPKKKATMKRKINLQSDGAIIPEEKKENSTEPVEDNPVKKVKET
eukprot:TRINITY_DN10650_c0_g1_i1.p1 TRINITY_DN10650_c0_g1~~TRINITY_DN10650_c0_g1_i1.p1  ORF type:complete len:270 (+),score=39.43 TRINITY_DN10650_c0_g1_i1:155-964(+)